MIICMRGLLHSSAFKHVAIGIAPFAATILLVRGLLRSVTIAHGGVLPNIHSVLLPKNKKGSKKSQAVEESEEFG